MVRAQKGYAGNATWLRRLAPFRMLSVSAAYLLPFFAEKGLSLTEIFVLQSVFSLAYVLLDVPSGKFADKYGRAFSIKLSAPVAAVSMIAYGFSDHFALFVLCELGIAVANSLFSGADTALLMDSLKATGRDKDYVEEAQSIDAWGFRAVAAGVPLGYVLVQYVGFGATLVAEGLLTLVAFLVALRLAEAPRGNGNRNKRLSTRQALADLFRSSEARWLLVLGSVLSASTYFGFWLSALYYQEMGIPVVAFGAVLAVRSVFKGELSQRLHIRSNLEKRLRQFAVLAGLVYLGMASGQLWLVWMLLGHDVVQALHKQPLAKVLNRRFDDDHRATLNSAASTVQRSLLTVTGPLVGQLVDRAGLQAGFLVLGLVSSSAALYALARLRRHGTFVESW